VRGRAAVLFHLYAVLRRCFHCGVACVFCLLFESQIRNSRWSFAPLPASGQVVSLPRELAKGLGCLVAAGVLAIGAGYSIPDSRLALSIGLTAVVVGVVAFVLFVLRALNVRRSE
jgi:hypothetical protein